MFLKHKAVGTDKCSYKYVLYMLLQEKKVNQKNGIFAEEMALSPSF